MAPRLRELKSALSRLRRCSTPFQTGSRRLCTTSGAAEARRGLGLARDARDPPRAARGGRQLQGREGLRRARAGAGARRRRDEEPHSGPGGRPDRPRRADDAHGQRRLQARLREQAADGDPPRGAPGVGQDDGGGEARAASAQGRSLAGARGRRPRSARRRSSSSSSSASEFQIRSTRPAIRSQPSRRASSRRAARARTWSSWTRPGGCTWTSR